MCEKPNPYRPGAGHSPPHLAGRAEEIEQFKKFLQQDIVTKNVILTGLRGVGKTVLMDDKYKPEVKHAGWAWVGSDFSESCFLTENQLSARLITDLSVFSSSLSIRKESGRLGFPIEGNNEVRSLSCEFLMTVYEATPGLTTDRLKAVLELVWGTAKDKGLRGIVFAYDEAQVVSDRQEKEQYPLAVLLETFQSIQRRGVNCMLLLTGLPTLFPRLVESRTYAERMFDVQEIGRLSEKATKEAILVPLEGYGWTFSPEALQLITEKADGYPYFIQFICREAFDALAKTDRQSIPIEPIVLKLDANFFSGRWDTLTDRQRDLLYCISLLPQSDDEFSISEIVESSKNVEFLKPFTANDISQMMPRMIDKGLIYKNRLGKYSFAVPLFSRFIKRRVEARRETRQTTLFDNP